MKILIANRHDEVRDTFLTEKTLTLLKSLGEVVENPSTTAEFTEEELKEKIKDIDVLITGWGSPAVTENVLKNAGKLKLHAHVGGTVAPVTSKEEFDAGIKVISGNNVFAQSVAEGCIGYFLTAQRRIPRFINQMKEEGWRRKEDTFEGLLYKKVGIIGYGAIAKNLCALLKAFRTEILIYSNHPVDPCDGKQCSLEEIFSTCDIISVHSSLTPATKGMIKKEHFDLMKEGALFVNTARGPIVDEKSLTDALKSGKIRAILDVYNEEPLPMDNPLRTLENAYLIPHMGGPTIDMRACVGYELAKDIERFAKGLPLENEISAAHASRMTGGTAKK